MLESKFTDFDVFVVDNVSTDGSVNEILRRYRKAVIYGRSFSGNARLTVIQNAKNLGGSGGFNTGLRIAYARGYPYLMCIDNDVFLDEIGMATGGTVSRIPLWLSLSALGFSVFMGMLAGFFPAQRAMRLSPLAALKN